jgi:hypothetical protein
MKISGFSFTRNADSLYYPVVPSIRSILPLCDEFIIAVGRGSDGDRTRDRIEAIGDPKIRIIDTDWGAFDPADRHIFSRQTDIALTACTGDWCFYLQADEVIHERYLDAIRQRCEDLLDDDAVEGLLFSYRHFWGDYDHYHISHRWYPEEIRIVRNRRNVRSWVDAQSFRINGRKLQVARVDAEVFHYGWVRPPSIMQNKNRAMESAYHPGAEVEKIFSIRPPAYDYGRLNKLATFRDTHPAVMREWIAAMNWKDELDYRGVSTARHPHDWFKYRFLTFLEQRFLGGRQIGGFKNYRLLKKK